jgi:hypothetical protein
MPKALLAKTAIWPMEYPLHMPIAVRTKVTLLLVTTYILGQVRKIVGAIKIGNHMAIGANCVVTNNIPDNAANHLTVWCHR